MKETLLSKGTSSDESTKINNLDTKSQPTKRRDEAFSFLFKHILDEVVRVDDVAIPGDLC